MNKSTSKYDANFTAGGLLINEFLVLKSILTSENTLEELKNEIEDNNLIAIKTKGARQRIITEITRRYNQVPKSFWGFFYELNLKEQKQALLYLCLKTYPLIFDIHFEVTVKKFKTSGRLIEYDIKMRIDEIASIDKSVADWSDLTLKKLNIQYRKTLKDAGLLKGNELIKSEIYNPIFWNYFKKNGDNWFLTACFIQN